MGTTRIKVIDLSSDKKEIKTSRKHAEKLALKPQKSLEDKEGQKNIEIASDQESQKASSPSQSSESSELAAPTPVDVKKKKAFTKKSKLRHKGKKYLEASTLVDRQKNYDLNSAIELLYKTSITKFDPTVEAHINVTEKNIRGSVKLPHEIAGIKKEKKYLIFSDKQEAIDKKTIIWGSEKSIEDIQNGTIKAGHDFDVVFSTSKFMPLLAKVAKVLGPAGMMPNPKNGTIIDDVKKAFEKGQDDGYEYNTDPTAPIVHTKIGKLSNKPEELSDNLKAIATSVGLSKISSITIASTMSPPIKLNVSSIAK